MSIVTGEQAGAGIVLGQHRLTTLQHLVQDKRRHWWIRRRAGIAIPLR